MRRLSTIEPGFEAQFRALLLDGRDTTTRVDGAVTAIIADVRARGDAALIDLTQQFDHQTLTPGTLRVSAAEIDAATASIPAPLADALDLAAVRIEAFHRAQMPVDLMHTDAAGLTLGLRWGPLDAVGLYVPGGKAAYPSSVLMNALPARVAGVPRICITEIYRVGGAQAVAAMAYGTASIAPVDRIVGPGNAYVAEAKRQVFGRVGIDSIAGPSEVVVLADQRQNPAHVALDLLAQAEHDEAAQSILITNDAGFAGRVAAAVDHALLTLPRAAIAGPSWRDHGAIIVTRDWEEAVRLTNELAPEHLQIMTADPRALFAQIRHAGAAFLGSWCPEALGDYVAGPNHVLPTGRTSRFASGLSVYDMLKRTTWVEADETALRAIGPATVALATAEGLHAHASSVSVRLDP